MTNEKEDPSEAQTRPALAAVEPAVVDNPIAGDVPQTGTGGSCPALVLGDATTDQILETYPLHPAAVRVWAWTLGLVILGVLVPVSIVATVAAGWWALLATVLAAVLAWRFGARHLRRAVQRFRCERFARGLRYRHGVWWQSETFIPSARVQHTEVNQGPIARRFGIGTLKVFTAAVQLGALEIDGLAYADALLLRDRLLSRNKPAPAGAAHAEEDAELHVGPHVGQNAAPNTVQPLKQDAAVHHV